MEWVNAVKGLSSLQLARNAKLNPRTVFVLSHKFRKALLKSRDMKPLSGVVDMDGTYVHPTPRKANKKTDRIDYRLKENQNPDKRCVMVAREHYSPEEKASNTLHCGAKHSHVFVAHTESQSVIKSFADKFIKPNIHTNQS